MTASLHAERLSLPGALFKLYNHISSETAAVLEGLGMNQNNIHFELWYWRLLRPVVLMSVTGLWIKSFMFVCICVYCSKLNLDQFVYMFCFSLSIEFHKKKFKRINLKTITSVLYWIYSLLREKVALVPRVQIWHRIFKDIDVDYAWLMRLQLKYAFSGDVQFKPLFKA